MTMMLKRKKDSVWSYLSSDRDLDDIIFDSEIGTSQHEESCSDR